MSTRLIEIENLFLVGFIDRSYFTIQWKNDLFIKLNYLQKKYEKVIYSFKI